jgi:hypothetical protein
MSFDESTQPVDYQGILELLGLWHRVRTGKRTTAVRNRSARTDTIAATAWSGQRKSDRYRNIALYENLIDPLR